MATKQETSLRVLMFPWLGYGHLSPYLELAKKLSNKNFYIYFCSTPINLTSLNKRLTSKSHPSIELVELHLPCSPELPPHHHTTNGLPPHLHKTLGQAFNMSQPNFSAILTTTKPDLIIYDIFMPWVPEIAASHNIPAVNFRCSGVAAASYFYSNFKLQGKGRQLPSSSGVYLREAEIRKMIQSAPLDTDAGEDPVYTCAEISSEIVLSKSCRDIEGQYIDFFSLLVNKKMVTVGLLAQVDDCDQEDEEEKDLEIMEWLGKKEKYSTVFVSFGSENYLSKKKMEELAHGLEISNVNFIWVIRFPKSEKVKIEEVLPEGFLERVKGRGIIVEGWAPQAKILGQSSSIGGFISHCGWSSVTESLTFGVPIIGIPMNFDQPLNARLVVELGVGLEVIKDENLEFDREEVARVVKEVVVGKSGEYIRRKVKELSEDIKLKEGDEISGAVEELKKLCNKNLGM